MEFSSDLPSPQNFERHANRPFFSIILPVYNACRVNPRYLIEALESVRKQTYKDFELIIVNDGSTDNSEGLCRDFISKNPDLSIRYHVKENEGQSSARNFGARAAHGAYLCFIDQDDLWVHNKLELKRPYLDLDLDLVYTDADVIDENGAVRMVGIHRNYQYGSPHPKRSIEDILFKDIYVMPGLMAIKKETFVGVNGFDETLSGYEDDDLFLRIYEAGKTTYLPVSTLKWRMYGSNYGQSTRMTRSRLLYHCKLLERYTNQGKDRRRVKEISRRFFQEFVLQAILQYENDNEMYLQNLQGAKQIVSLIPFGERIVFRYFLSFEPNRAIGKMIWYGEKKKDLRSKRVRAKNWVKNSFWRSLFRLKDLAHNNGPPWLRKFFLRIAGIQELRDQIGRLTLLMDANLGQEVVSRIYLKGNGIGIGPLDAPLAVSELAKVRSIDRMSLQQLLLHYPGSNLVHIDIIGDEERLDFIKDSSQDFVITNHFFEHFQDPIGAIWNMLRVLKSAGVLYLAIPDKQERPDTDRPATSIEHLLKDYEEGPSWSKRAHFEEFVRFVERVEDKAAAEHRLARLLNQDYRIDFHSWTQTEMLELFLILKRTLHFPFEIEVACKCGWEMVFILRKRT